MYIKRLACLLMAFLLLCCGALASQGAFPRGYSLQDGWQYLYFGSYPQAHDGTRRPILWRVLQVEDGRAYLQSDRILDVKRVHHDQWHYAGWLQSDLRAWLLDAFLHKAFSAEEQAALSPDAELGAVSLPSADDIMNPGFGYSNDKDRFFYGSDWAKEQGLFAYTGAGHSPVFTRTPSSRSHAHLSTKMRGNIGFIGVESDDLGVLPVIWLDTSRIRPAAGDGSVHTPFCVEVTED